MTANLGVGPKASAVSGETLPDPALITCHLGGGPVGAVCRSVRPDMHDLELDLRRTEDRRRDDLGGRGAGHRAAVEGLRAVGEHLEIDGTAVADLVVDADLRGERDALAGGVEHHVARRPRAEALAVRGAVELEGVATVAL